MTVRLPRRTVGWLILAALGGTGAVLLAYPDGRLVASMLEADGELEAAAAMLQTWNRRHPADYDSRWHAAELFLRMSRPVEASAVLDTMVRDWPRDRRVLEQQLLIEESLCSEDAALLRLEALAQYFPDDSAIQTKLADRYRWHDRTEQLVATLQRLVALGDFPEERDELVDLLLDRQRYDEAIALLCDDLATEESSAQKHSALYEAYQRSGERDRALEHLRRAVALEPQPGHHLRELADALVQRGQVDEALALYRDRLRQEPADPSLQRQMGELLQLRTEQLVGAGRRDEAIRLLRERVRAAPRDVQLRLDLAELYGKKATAVAIAELRQLLKIDPDNQVAWVALGERLSWSGRTKAAAGAFFRAVALAPDDLSARRSLALHQLWSGDEQRALHHMRVIVAHAPTDEDRVMAVDLMLGADAAAEALPHASELVRRQPDNVHYRELLANAAVEAKRCDIALPQLQWLAQRRRDDVEAWSQLGACATELGQKELADEAFEVIGQRFRGRYRRGDG